MPLPLHKRHPKEASGAEPVSPMNTLAGLKFQNKKPIREAASAQENNVVPEYPSKAEIMKKPNVTTNVTEEARPSRPSVRFTAFTIPTIQKTMSG